MTTTTITTRDRRSWTRRSWTEAIMGLPFSIHRRGHAVDSDAFAGVVFHDLREADRKFSPYLDDSELSQLSVGLIRRAALSPEFRDMLRLAETFRLLTDGAFDINAGPELDPCGLVKGWATQRASRHLPPDAYLNAGGDMVIHSDGQPWRIGIEHPWNQAGLLAVLAVRGGAVATSGSAHRGSHILNPATGSPATGLTQVTVIGADLTEADVWATALIARGTTIFQRTDPLRDRFTGRGYDALVVTDDGQLIGTDHFLALAAPDVPAPRIRRWPSFT